MPRIGYDREADAMFISFGPEGVKSAETEEVAPGIMLDFDDKGEVIRVAKSLCVSQRATAPKAG